MSSSCYPCHIGVAVSLAIGWCMSSHHCQHGVLDGAMSLMTLCCPCGIGWSLNDVLLSAACVVVVVVRLLMLLGHQWCCVIISRHAVAHIIAVRACVVTISITYSHHALTFSHCTWSPCSKPRYQISYKWQAYPLSRRRIWDLCPQACRDIGFKWEGTGSTRSRVVVDSETNWQVGLLCLYLD